MVMNSECFSLSFLGQAILATGRLLHESTDHIFVAEKTPLTTGAFRKHMLFLKFCFSICQRGVLSVTKESNAWSIESLLLVWLQQIMMSKETHTTALSDHAYWSATQDKESTVLCLLLSNLSLTRLLAGMHGKCAEHCLRIINAR